MAICLSTLGICAQQLNFERTYGLPGYNYGKRVLQTKDGGYLILGNKSGFTGSSDIYLIKTDTLGVLMLDKAIGNASIEVAEDIKPTFDNGYIIAGYCNYGTNNDYQILLIKIDSLYNVEWLKNYGGTNWDFGYSVVQCPDSGFMVSGETFSYGNGNNDVFILKTDADGTKLWHKAYGGQNEDVAKSISPYKNGFVISGYTNSFGNGQYDCYILNIEQSGDTLWTKTYGDSLDDKAYCVKQVHDTAIVFCGYTENYGAQRKDALIVKIDSTGNEKWKYLYGDLENDIFIDFVNDINNDLVFFGNTNSFGSSNDYYLLKTTTNCTFLLSKTYGDLNSEDGSSIYCTADSGYVVCGSTESYGIGISNIYVIKMNNSGISTGNVINETSVKENNFYSSNLIVYPNPSDGKIILKNYTKQDHLGYSLNIYDTKGKLVFSSYELGPFSNLVFDLSFLKMGFYIIELYSANIVYRKKLSIY
ncbi:T9SS type A sorting domain-containing protein [Bacteroidota bacterium]